ncbi:MAG: Unknown protein [uncultured Sulfurovum sp.]|uniref:Uncharacterized protein n=1 Tax=uncultured Sulfurovum sp. TaxID=269237 RepID=A0A6S6T8Q3_9BACT|nr:MAG: Unknown protein [uncultured Sulfurovum sp.]
MKKILIALSVLATTQIAMATATPITTIKDIYVYETSVVIKLANQHTNPDICTHPKAKEYLLLSTDTAGGNRLYSAILSAYVSGKKVRFGYKNCANWSATETVPKAYGVSMVE